MSTAAAPVVRTPDELTSEWLAEVLDRPGLRIASVVPIGTGQMSSSYRVALEEGGSVVVKLASANADSRGTGVGMGAYRREVLFYSDLASRFGDAVPACHHAAYDEAEGWFTLVLEDIEGGRQGDQIAGCSVEEAEAAVRALARVHGPVLGDLHVGTKEYLNQPNPLNQALTSMLLPGFLERYGPRIAPEHVEVCERFVAVLDAWWADQRPPLGLVHGDFRLDNLLFRDGRCTVVDWQTVMWGSALYDLSYLVAGSLEPEVRREQDEALVRLYHDELLAQDVHALSWETCWEEYRRQVFGGILMTIVASMVVERTERGDEMFMTTLRRTAQMALDLGSLDLLPDAEAAAGPPVPLQPAPEDEGRHEPGSEQTWNESWYFDAVSDDGSLGFYHRLGRVPNQDLALMTTAIVRPGGPAVLLLDPAAPLPPGDDDAQAVRTDRLQAEQHCLEPLRTFRVTGRGTAEAFADEAAPLRAEAGEPVEVSFDLTWETDGTPFQWRQSTRYEIPCRVSGTVTVGDETYELSGPGQRDHSWGSRDWFASDWMWNALHLDDGTHTHAVGVPGMPGFGVGYQQRDGDVTELTGLDLETDVADSGLPTSCRTTLKPGDVEMTITPVAFGALRLEAPDGRVTHFPRAMARVECADGRRGTGWIEWNRNQR